MKTIIEKTKKIEKLEKKEKRGKKKKDTPVVKMIGVLML